MSETKTVLYLFIGQIRIVNFSLVSCFKQIVTNKTVF